MKMANRVPARLKQIRRKFLEMESGSMDTCTGNNLESKIAHQTDRRLKPYKATRLDIIKHCNQILSRSYPKVLLTRTDEVRFCDSIPKNKPTITYPKGDQSYQQSLIKNFTEWIVSIVVISLLLLPASFTGAAVNSENSVILDNNVDLSSSVTDETDTETPVKILSRSVLGKSEIKCEGHDASEEHESESERSSDEEFKYSTETSSSIDSDEDKKPLTLNYHLIKTEKNSESGSSNKIRKKPGKASGFTCDKLRISVKYLPINE